VSANVSYQHAEEDVELFTGIQVAAKTQQRLVHRQTFEMPEVKQFVEELSVDGVRFASALPRGTLHLARIQGCACTTLSYRGIFPRQRCPDRVGQPPTACLTNHLFRDDGVWNIIDEIAPNGERREILDWYHLMENLHKVGGSLKRLRQAETLLWQGQVDAAKALFADCTTKQAQNFINYDKHCDRIVNYQYYQAEQICSIGSGAVESAVKQIDRRTKISGAQWNKENVPQVLAHRCAYLNGLLTV